jgi:vacuolar-type H+-ATPase subunit D/Vma8
MKATMMQDQEELMRRVRQHLANAVECDARARGSFPDFWRSLAEAQVASAANKLEIVVRQQEMSI